MERQAPRSFLCNSSTVAVRTGTCASFASLAVGSTFDGKIEVDVAIGESFSDADIVDFELLVHNPAIPSGPAGDPFTDNPLVLESRSGTAASNGTAGTVITEDPNTLSGRILLELLVLPFSWNGAFPAIDLATGRRPGTSVLLWSGHVLAPGRTERGLRRKGQFFPARG